MKDGTKKIALVMDIISAVVTTISTSVILILLFIGLLNVKVKSIDIIGIFIIFFIIAALALSIATIVLGRRSLRDMKNGMGLSGAKKVAIISLVNSIVLFALAIISFVRNTESVVFVSLLLAIIIFVCSIILFVGIKEEKNQY